MKKELIYSLILAVVFVGAMLIKTHFVDPVADEAYAEIYGTEEVGF
ncbi:hypothetical protein [Jeotgalicoccus marinus]|nr:hypothetical protein [Jeotgalicoccus marinus]